MSNNPSKLSLPSALGHDFAKVQSPQNPRSSFDRSFTRKTTFRSGALIPVYVSEVLPGDTVSMNANFVARLSTLQFPIMDNIHLDTFWFFAPWRILWDNWKRFNGERLNPSQSIDVIIPTLGGDPLQINPFSIGDYFGLPIGEYDVQRINAGPFRMYNKVYNDWFRDQNLQNSVAENVDDGPDTLSDYNIMNRGKRHDYFTSCLPWPQKGDAVPIPIAATAPVIGTGRSLGLSYGGLDSGVGMYAINGSQWPGLTQNAYDQPLGTAIGSAPNYAGTTLMPLGVTTIADDSGLIAVLGSSTATTVNDLREAIAIQQLLELDARGGTRYIEQMKHMWGVTVPDYTMQRPEYLGGSSERMGIHPVAQTAPGDTPQGSLSAFGQMATESGFTHSFLEHGYIMCIVQVRADITYQQGLHKMWSRETRYDFYQPPLAHLGEQPVLRKELYFANDEGSDQTVFGYQERWAEYRYEQNLVTAAFRSNYALTLDAWHLALEFDTPPILENGFIEDQPPISRVLATTAEEDVNSQILFDMYGSSRWARIMPVYSTPGLERL